MQTNERRDQQSATRGMTVIELLVIVAALAVIIMVAVPTSSMVIEHYRLKAASSGLVDGLNLARGEALRRNSTVRVCPSLNGRFCRSDGDWSQGWLVYTDGNGDGTVQDIELIQAFDGPKGDVRIVAKGAAETAASFTVAGLTPANDTDSAEFIVCYPGSKVDARIILVDPEGWVSLMTSPSQACTPG